MRRSGFYPYFSFHDPEQGAIGMPSQCNKKEHKGCCCGDQSACSQSRHCGICVRRCHLLKQLSPAAAASTGRSRFYAWYLATRCPRGKKRKREEKVPPGSEYQPFLPDIAPTSLQQRGRGQRGLIILTFFHSKD